MEFARSHLESHGWSEGKGLGRHESGMKDAIKVKLKFDTTGVGHNRADEFTHHWWSQAFDQAANNIKVDESKEGVSVKMDGSITLRTTKRVGKNISNKEMLYGRFVKAATLTNGTMEEESKTSSSESESEDDDGDLNRIKQVTDEELFKLCGGRTAHKGARHGLTATAKLSRIEEQEAAFMAKWAPTTDVQPTKIETDKKVKCENTSEDNESPAQCETEKKKKKRKKKKSKDEDVPDEPSSGYSSDTNDSKDLIDTVVGDSSQEKSQKKKKKKKNKEKDIDGDASDHTDSLDVKEKKKKQKRKIVEEEDKEVADVEHSEKSKKTKKKKKKSKDCVKDELGEDQIDQCQEQEQKKKKRKLVEDVLEESASIENDNISESSEPKKKKKKKSKK